MSERHYLYNIFSVLRILLSPFALIYGAMIWLRNRLYDTGFFSTVEFSVPIISVGNLSVGGTGKTPHVEYLIRLLQYEYKVATMSRGYKRRTQGFMIAGDTANALKIGDEPMQYHMKYPDVVVSVAEERITGIPYLLQSAPDVEVILLDDAYQHRSVKAGVNILITDHAQPFYKDHILPLGRLRESRRAYKRATMIIVSKCPADLTATQADDMVKRIKPLPHQQVFFSTIAYKQPYDLVTGEPISLSNTNAVLVCCIANPAPLVAHVRQQAQDVHVLSYQDHHYFTNGDLEEIKAAHDNWDVLNKLIITTEKDAARLHLHIDKIKEWGISIAVLPIEISLLFNNDEALQRIVLDYVSATISENQMTYGDEQETKE
jgi:tetraacyldisaccharide 4'-kinase